MKILAFDKKTIIIIDKHRTILYLEIKKSKLIVVMEL